MNERIDQFLASQLDQLKHHNSGQLITAMEYTLLNGGKRMRPKLAYATAQSIGLAYEVADHIAASIEMIHAYSLIHDDLPAMDDDDLRRGQATCHIKFDEATAILAADALQTMAFECLSQTTINPSTIIKLIQNLAKSAGATGMVGGQMLDLEAEGKTLNIAELQEIHSKKTGALLQSCVTMVTDCDNSMTQDKRQHFKAFAEHFGIAYQIIDDVLDVSSDTETLGKPAQSDLKNNKSTYPSLLGLDHARNKAKEHVDAAASHLSSLNNTSKLYQLLQLVAMRTF